LLATSAWAGPGNGKSEQWVPLPSQPFEWPFEVPPLDNEVVIMVMGGTAYVNEATVNGTAKGYVFKWDVDGLIIRPAAGNKIYLLKKNASQTEIGHGSNPYAYWPDMPPYLLHHWGIVNCRWVFEAEGGEQLIFKILSLYEWVDGAYVEKKGIGEWTFKP
jgi:hypothetical protein